jgi:hypothetical protein
MYVLLQDESINPYPTKRWFLCLTCNDCEAYDEVGLDSDDIPLDRGVELALRVRGWTKRPDPTIHSDCWCRECSAKRKAA